MKLLDFFVNQHFKKDNDENQLFFPWGIWGKGHKIDNPETEYKIRKFLQTYYLVFLASLLLWVLGINPLVIFALSSINRHVSNNFPNGFIWVEALICLIFTLIFYAWQYLGTRSFVERLPAATVKLTWEETLRANSKTVPPVLLWLGQIATVFAVLAGLLVFWLSVMKQDVMMSIFGFIDMILFGFASFAYMRMLALRNK